LPEVRWGDPSKKIPGKLKDLRPAKSAHAAADHSEAKMVLFSRSFVRKRVISLATTVAFSATSFAFAEGPPKTHHVHGAMPIQTVAEEQPFLSENDAAMNKMMADMTIKPTGDVDRDFVAMMVPHHQGAIDMAKAELKYGHNEQLRRLAQEIVAHQREEIAVMRTAVSDGRSSAVQSPEQPAISTAGSVADGGMKMSQ
jgi:hypothetical protein